MAVPTPQVKIPQLQREPASLQPEKTDRLSARSLLNNVFKKKRDSLPTAQDIQAEHAQLFLDTPIGRNFNLITAAGVEFQVHSAMLIGGSKMLQEGLFPGGANPSTPPMFVNLPPNFHPILVDCIVKFIYTSDYDFALPLSARLKQSNFKFYHATLVPDTNPPPPATTALVGTRDYELHLHMYALAEELDYPALKSAAYVKLVDMLVTQRIHNSTVVKEAIDSTFSPLGNENRICKDQDGVLQQAVVVAVIAHQAEWWNVAQQVEFTESIQGPEYADFRSAYDVVCEENKDLIHEYAVFKALDAERMKIEVLSGKAQIVSDAKCRRRFAPSLGSLIQNHPSRMIKTKKERARDIMRVKAAIAAREKEKEKEKAGGDGDLEMEVQSLALV